MSIARKAKSQAPMEELFSVSISREAGVAGDFRGASKRQVTVLSRDSWRQVCEALNTDLSWLTRRANLLIQGFEFLPNDVGSKIRIGEVVLEIMGETEPCSRMEQAHAGLYEALLPAWRGGVYCRVLQGGEIRTGGSIKIIN